MDYEDVIEERCQEILDDCCWCCDNAPNWDKVGDEIIELGKRVKEKARKDWREMPCRNR